LSCSEPPRIARLHHDKHGRPVPWFVAWLKEGADAPAGSPGAVPDFRIVKPGAIGAAWSARLCWVCGMLIHKAEPRAFVVGPMCVINRVSAEPPGHHECGVYSATHCPFLITPNMIRRERHLPPGTSEPPGVFLRRNPGATAIYVTKRNTATMHREGDGVLFDLGEPQWVEWYAEGREATRAEVVRSIETGLPSLIEACQGDEAQLMQLDTQHAESMRLLPA
jgi:hypothetical protein